MIGLCPPCAVHSLCTVLQLCKRGVTFSLNVIGGSLVRIQNDFTEMFLILLSNKIAQIVPIRQAEEVPEF